MELKYEDYTYKVIGACMNVHSELGSGFLESVYQEALEIEFEREGIEFEREVELRIVFRETYLKKKFVADFICYGTILLEVKALSTIASVHVSQVINYLKVTELELGLLVNFGTNKLQFKRIVL